MTAPLGVLVARAADLGAEAWRVRWEQPALPWAFLAAFWTAAHLLVRAWWVGAMSVVDR